MKISKIKLESFIYWIFVFSLLVDNINGYFLQNNILLPISIGQLYRFFVIIIMVIFVCISYRKSKNNFPKILILPLFLAFFSIVYFMSHNSLSGFFHDLLYITKLFYPILIVVGLYGLYKREYITINVIHKAVKTFIVLAPLTLIIPSVLGIGFSSYGNLGGYKGFYVSNNEINIVLASTYIYAVHPFFNKKNFKNFIILMLNAISLFMIASKTSLLILVVVFFIYCIKNIKNTKQILWFIILIIMLIICYFLFFQELVADMLIRFEYFYTTLTSEGNILDFLMSTRNRRVLPALQSVMFNGSVDGIVNCLIGIGRYSQVNPDVLSTLMELDFFDTWLWYGIITAIIIFIYYVKILFKRKKDEKLFPFYIMHIVILLFSLTAGHVWYSPLSGTMLSLIYCYIVFYDSSKCVEKKNLISVIVPVYNVEKYIKKCVESIENQTYDNLEILLIDDGSTDSSGKICDKLAKKNKKINVIHKENGGLSDARNAGIEVAKGNYFVFIDSDDYIHQDMILSLYKNLKDYDADISVCNYRKVPEDEGILDVGCNYKISVSNKNLYENMYNKFGNYTIVAWNKLYKRELFEEVRYPVGKIHEDEYIIHKLISKCSCMVYDSRKYYHYVQRGNSITASFNLKRLHVFSALEERLNFFKKKKNKKLYDMTLKTYCLTLMYWWKVLIDYPEYSKERDMLMKKFNDNYEAVLSSKYISMPNKLKIKIAAVNPNLLLKLMTLKRKIKG